MRLLEKISTNYFNTSYKPFVFFFGRGGSTGPSTIIFKDEVKNTYSVLLLKSKNLISSYLIKQSRENGLPDKGIWEALNVLIKNKGYLKKAHKDLTDKKFVEFMAIKNAVPMTFITEVWPELKDGTMDFEPHLNFKIAGHKNDKELDKIKGLLNMVVKYYKKIGMDKKLAYGDILLTGSLGRALADYNRANDSIRLSPKAFKSNDGLQSLLHEVAHRWYNDHLSSEQRKAIHKKWIEEAVSKSATSSMAIGDKYQHPKLGDIEVVSTDYNKRSFEQYFVIQGEKDGKKVKYRVPNAALLRDEGAVKTSGNSDVFGAFDVSTYARSVDTEFFPEIVSFGLLGNNKELMEWIKLFV